MAIEKDEIILSENKHLREVVDELFQNYSVRGGKRHKKTLRQWVIKESEFFKNFDFLSNYTDDPFIKKDQKLIVPKDKLSLLEIISDRKISRSEIGNELEARLKEYKEQRRDSCCNFANGGVNYELYIKHIGGNAQIWYKKNGAEQGEYSDGKFYTFYKQDRTSDKEEENIEN